MDPNERTDPIIGKLVRINYNGWIQFLGREKVEFRRISLWFPDVRFWLVRIQSFRQIEFWIRHFVMMSELFSSRGIAHGDRSRRDQNQIRVLAFKELVFKE